MGDQTTFGPDTSHEERSVKRMHVIYTRKMRERQIFMDDLKYFRQQNDKRLMRQVVKSIGPSWYHTLSVPQRMALDTLEISIYKDILEGRPCRTFNVMKALGLYPRPNLIDLMACVMAGRDDPKAMLAHLFLNTYGHTIDGRRYSYNLNAKLMLSGILYLGLDKLIESLKEKFRPPPYKEVKEPKVPHKIEPPLASPYLQKLVAYLYIPPKRKPFCPEPLPNMEELLESMAANGINDDEFTIAKPPPPPPLPPPPKKKLPKSLCDKLAGIYRIEPYVSPMHLPMKTSPRSIRRSRGSKTALNSNAKSYSSGCKAPKGPRRRKPKAPVTGMWNSQYMILGVFTIQGKTAYVLGNIITLPAAGEIIHRGHRTLDGQLVNIHGGIRGHAPPPKSQPCDCLKSWTDTVFGYLKRTKCQCGHNYDFGHEGNFPPEEVPYFQKPTRNTPYSFNYNTIYNLDPKRAILEKEFKRVWETDSMLAIDEPLKDKKKDKKKKKQTSTTCLPDNPKPEDYLRVVLRLMKGENLAACLPDIHLVPELKEWMRRRIYGPIPKAVRGEMLRKSRAVWTHFNTLGRKGYGHVPVPTKQEFSHHTNWSHKQGLNDKFRTFTQEYRMMIYRSHAKVSNMLWPSMCQAEFPDKKFREIFFSYLFSKIEDVTLISPYSTREALERKFRMATRPYCCNIGMEVMDQ